MVVSAIHLKLATGSEKPTELKNFQALNVKTYHYLVVWGTHDPNFSGYSEMSSSLMRSLSGPRMTTGL